MTRTQHYPVSAKSPKGPFLPLACTCLWLSVTASALGVVYATFATRQAVQELEELRDEAADLQVKSGQFLLEKSTLAAYTRVEAEAESKLDMQVPPAASLHLVNH